ncbi:MAG: DUF3782 domain-containing protein [Pseudanabaenaceae cyanobacterium]|jgi:hypothetical protein
MSQPVTIKDIYKLFEQTNAALARSSEEFDRRIAESRAEAEQRAAEADKRMAEFDKQMKELGKQIGGLGAKFGSFTEGLALPSMTKILGEQFGMEVISPSIRVRKGKENIEVDVLAYANGEINTAYVVEVKSHAKPESIDQLKSILNNFRRFFPEHSNKTVYGILAAVDIPEALKEKALTEGLYVARISDDTFEMDTPKDFQPKTW